MQTFSAVHPPSRRWLLLSHRLRQVCFHRQSAVFTSPLRCPLPHSGYLFKSVLFNLQTLGDSPVVFLLLTSGLSSFWSDDTQGMKPILLNLLRSVPRPGCGPRRWPSRCAAPPRLLWMSVRSCWWMVVFSSSKSWLLFGLEVLRCLRVLCWGPVLYGWICPLLLSGSSLGFTSFEVLSSGTHTFRIIISSWQIEPHVTSLFCPPYFTWNSSINISHTYFKNIHVSIVHHFSSFYFRPTSVVTVEVESCR